MGKFHLKWDNKKTFFLTVAILVFLTLSVGTSLTKRPWSDEGWFAGAGYNLTFHHHPGTLVLEPRGFREGIDRYTYWTAPLYYPLQAVWYKAFGFSLFSMRTLSTVFGLIYVLSWFLISYELFEDKRVALLTGILLSVDYVVVMGSSFGRMDIICSAFGAAAFASYLWFRKKNLFTALVTAQILVMLSGLTHFLGILYFLGLFTIVFSMDRKNISIRAILLSFVPYFIGAILWGLYIWQEPSLFLTQFLGNASDSGRMNSLLDPLRAISDEIFKRYFVAYGLGNHSAGNTGPVMLKSLVLITYILGLLGVVFIKHIRTQTPIKLLLIISTLFVVIVTFLDGQKLSYYLLNFVPFYTIFVAAVLVFLWQGRFVGKSAAIGACMGLVLLQTAGLAYRMRIDGYGNQFMPAVNFIRQHSDGNTLTMASAEMAFELGFEGSVIDDNQLGYERNRRLPDYFVVEEVYQIALEGSRLQRPHVYSYIQDTLKSHYSLVYDQNHYLIYKLIDSSQKNPEKGH